NYRIATKPVGETAALTVWRNGSEMTADIGLAAPPSTSDREIAISGNTRFAGATAAALSPALAQRLGLGFSTQGVAIVTVEPGSPAQRLGLQAGDIILALNGMEIRDIETFQSLAAQRPRSWEIVIQRGGRMIRSI